MKLSQMSCQIKVLREKTLGYSRMNAVCAIDRSPLRCKNNPMPKTNDIATKKFVKGELEKNTREIKEWVGARFTENTEEIKEWVDTVFAKYKDETMTKLDEIADMLQKDDQERTILSYQVSEHTDQLEDHGRRIKKLEKTPPIAPVP